MASRIAGADPELPKVLYHYTRQAGLLGILKDRAMWATQIQYLNDAREFILAAEIVYRKGADLYKHDPFWPVIQYLKDLRDYEAYDDPIFVVSFSGDGDLLSQWRAYGSAGDNYSLGFQRDRLARVAARHGWTLAPVAYSFEDQALIAEAVLAETRAHFDTLTAQGAPAEEACRYAIPTLLSELVRNGPLIKHKSFAEEREWRLISPAIPYVQGCLKFRPGRHTLLPYRLFDLKTEDEALAKLDVFVGPGAHINLAVKATTALLAKNRIKSSVTGSQVSFRDW